MNSLYKQAKAFYLRNKVSDFEYDCVREELYKTNLAVLSVCSFVVSVLFFLLGFVSLFVPANPVLRAPYTYFIIFIITGSIFVISRKLPEDRHKLSVPLVYFFIWGISIYTGLAGVVATRTNYSIMFVVFEFAYPVLFIDKIRRLYLNSAVLSLAFSVLTFFIKDFDIRKSEQTQGFSDVVKMVSRVITE